MAALGEMWEDGKRQVKRLFIASPLLLTSRHGEAKPNRQCVCLSLAGRALLFPTPQGAPESQSQLFWLLVCDNRANRPSVAFISGVKGGFLAKVTLNY